MPAKRFDDQGNRIIGIAKNRNQRRKETWTKEQLEQKAKHRQELRRAKRAKNYKPLTEEEIELVKSGQADKSLKMRYAWYLKRDEFCKSIRKTRSTKESRELTSKLSTQMMSSEEFRKNISDKEVEYCKDPAVRERLSNNSKKLFTNEAHRKLISNLSKQLWENPDIAVKRYNTMKKRNSFSKSIPEEEVYALLIDKFSEEDVIRQYIDSRYKSYKTNRCFHCDFYIKSLDLFIEYQGSWTHHDQPYDENNIEHQKIVESWLNKSKEINFKGEPKRLFSRAIQTWTERDPLKRKVAKENNLNWKEFFTVDEVKAWLETLS